MIIVLHGLPGVGKSTLSGELASITSGMILGTNYIRKHVLNHHAFKKTRVTTFPFSRDEVALSYRVMFFGTELLAKAGRSVILDATFQKKEYINVVKEIAKKTNTECFVLRVVCDEEVCKLRMEERVRAKKSDSIVDYKHHQKMKEEHFEDYKEADFEFDTSKDPEPQWRELRKVLTA